MNSMKNHSIMKVIRSYDSIAHQFIVCIYNPVHTTTERFEDGSRKTSLHSHGTGSTLCGNVISTGAICVKCKRNPYQCRMNTLPVTLFLRFSIQPPLVKALDYTCWVSATMFSQIYNLYNSNYKVIFREDKANDIWFNKANSCKEISM